MESVFKKSPVLDQDYDIYGVSSKYRMLLLMLPAVLLLAFTLAWFIPDTHKYVLWLSKENKPVELFTFLFLFFGGLTGVFLAKFMKEKGATLIAWASIAIFSIGLFLIAMEEISWGQQFLKFSTPEALREINEQDELTLHNIQGLHGNSEYFHLFFGLAGLIGIWLKLGFLNEIRVPRMLAGVFSCIVLTAVFDLSNDFFQYEYMVSYFTRRLSEVNEMLIGFAGFAYIILLFRKYKRADYLLGRNRQMKKERITDHSA